jgi:dienelactone hydrolase
MNLQPRLVSFVCVVCCLVFGSSSLLVAQQPFPSPKSLKISETEHKQITQKLAELQAVIDTLKQENHQKRLLGDVEIYAKAADWILRHGEFYRPGYAKDTVTALETGLKRAGELSAGKPSWVNRSGSVILGYYSKVDGSVQPYALSLPEKVDPQSGKRWPLYVKLHGRGSTLNEVSFIKRHDNKPLAEGQDWIQLDIFGRVNNAYRWSGETDVFEAMADVEHRFRIDNKRITLHGFSMGGSGAWHLGLHYPSLWSSVGPGAGFIDFYQYQKQTQRRPDHQHKMLGIYDSIDYVLNAANVPICIYVGELDTEFIANNRMVDEAKKSGVDIKLIIGKGTGHKFTPKGFQEFMAFHQAKSKQGRKPFPGRRSIHFVTKTLKYNKCEWLTIEEMIKQYEPTVVKGDIDKEGTLILTTQNVAVLRLDRGIADSVSIDEKRFLLNNAARGLLPGVYYELDADGWELLDYDTSRKFIDNPDLQKRHNLQGAIDDAFMQPFVCVRGTGKPWSQANHDWAEWTLNRFEREFDKWLRGKIQIVDDTDVTEKMIRKENLILFGDPGSNGLLAKVIGKLPVTWTKESLEVNGRTYDPNTHGLSLIYPNPLAPRRYVVVNSGHTIHEKDFRASNSWLFPRLGDIAVQKFVKQSTGAYSETVDWVTIFNSGWQLPK